MTDKFNLNRFIKAQEKIFGQALLEMENGKKTSHWMWFIFPQISGLGNSTMAIQYAISNKEEAIAYYNHPLLGKRLQQITLAFLSNHDKSAFNVLGTPDDLKLKSSMTLFHSIQTDTDIFKQVLSKFYEDEICELTLSNL